MRRILFLFCLFWSVHPGWADTTTAPPPTSLSFRLHHGFLIVVPVQIGSLSNLKFILDTGTTRTIVDKKVARKLGIRGVPDTVTKMQNRLGVETAVFPDLRFGVIHATNIRLLIGDLFSITQFGDGVDGILGLDVFWGSKISIDYNSKTLKADTTPVEIGEYIQEGDIVCVTTRAEIHGNAVRLLVDTGIRGILLYADRMGKRISSFSPPSPRFVRLGDAMSASQLKLDKIRIGTDEINNVDALVVSSAPGDLPRNIDGILGIECLKARHVILDFSHKNLTWEH